MSMSPLPGLPWRAALGGVTALLVVAQASACSDAESSTELHPEGPPMVRQVILSERYLTSAGEEMTRLVIGFGSHPDADASEQHRVSSALAGNRIRVVMDELLVGNYLEEVLCDGQVDDDHFSRVPVGATPDDLAKCSGSPEQLAKSCKGDKAVCIRGDGVAIGIRDRFDAAGQPYKDGLPDVTHMIAGVAGVRCLDTTKNPPQPIDVPMDLARSYWQPAGNQQRPIVEDGLRGLASLGPAVVLVPEGDLPTSLSCGIFFASSVVDKSGIRPCAPEDGDLSNDCTPGDTARVEFTTEQMRLTSQTPLPEALNVSRTADIVARASAAFDPAVQVTSEPPATFSVAPSTDQPRHLIIRPTVPLLPATRYVLTVPLRDVYGLGPLAPATLSFTTAAL